MCVSQSRSTPVRPIRFLLSVSSANFGDKIASAEAAAQLIRAAGAAEKETIAFGPPSSCGETARSQSAARQTPSGPRAHAHHEAVVGQLRHLQPLVRVAAESREAVQHLLEMRIALRQLGIDLVRRVVARLHDRLRERAQLRALGDEALERLRI